MLLHGDDSAGGWRIDRDSGRWWRDDPEGMIDEPQLAEELRAAIVGRGAFRRFKDLVHRDEAIGRRWQRFNGERQRGRAREWLAEHGYRPIAHVA